MMTRKGNAFKITLPNRNFEAKEAAVTTEIPKKNEDTILSFIASNGQITRSDVERILHISQATANRLLKHMIREELIYQESSGRNTRYKKL